MRAETYLLAAIPRGKASARGGRMGKRAHTDPATRQWMTRAAAAIRQQRGNREPIRGPVEVEIIAVFPRPAYLVPDFDSRAAQPTIDRIAHVVKPDADNVTKMVLDTLVKAGVLGDDARAAYASTRKWWAAFGEEPGLDIVVRDITDEQPWAAWAVLRGERPDEEAG